MGMILFGTMISLFVDYFVSEEKIEEDIGELTVKVDAPDQKLDRIQKTLEEKRKTPE